MGLVVYFEWVCVMVDYVCSDLGGNIKDIVLDIMQVCVCDFKVDVIFVFFVDELSYIESFDGIKDFFVVQC